MGVFASAYRSDYEYVSKDRVARPIPRDDSTVTFWKLAQIPIDAGRTMLRHDRLYVLWQAIGNTVRLRLPFVEVGSYKGGSAYFLASAARYFLGAEPEGYVFDTFEGHPPRMDEQHDPHHKHGAGNFLDTSYEDVKRYLAPFPQVQIHKGDFLINAPTLPRLRPGLVHLDVDTYTTTAGGLAYFAPNLPAGGVIVVDDFGSPTCPGVDKAVSEFLAARPGFHLWQCRTKQAILVRVEAT